jgi:hypothetical protein
MKSVNIGFSILLGTSLVLAVACADNRGFRAFKTTPENLAKAKAEQQKKRGEQPADQLPSADKIPKGKDGKDAPKGQPAAPVFGTEDVEGLGDFAKTIGIGTDPKTKPKTHDNNNKDPKVDKELTAAEKADLARNQAKLEEIDKAKRPESAQVIKGISARMVTKGQQAEIGVDIVLDIKSEDVYVYGLGILTADHQLDDKQIVSLVVKATDQTGKERRLPNVEIYAACRSEKDSQKKTCARVTVMALIIANEKSDNKFAAVVEFVADAKAKDGMMVKQWSSLGDQFRYFADAQTRTVEPTAVMEEKVDDGAEDPEAKAFAPRDAKPTDPAKSADDSEEDPEAKAFAPRNSKPSENAQPNLEQHDADKAAKEVSPAATSFFDDLVEAPSIDESLAPPVRAQAPAPTAQPAVESAKPIVKPAPPETIKPLIPKADAPVPAKLEPKRPAPGSNRPGAFIPAPGSKDDVMDEQTSQQVKAIDDKINSAEPSVELKVDNKPVATPIQPAVPVVENAPPVAATPSPAAPAKQATPQKDNSWTCYLSGGLLCADKTSPQPADPNWSTGISP